MEVSGEVSNGLVKVIMSGKGAVKSIKIDNSVKEDIEVLSRSLQIIIREQERFNSNIYY